MTSSFWNVATQEAFAAGGLTNVSVNGNGAVTLAPPLEPLEDTEELYIWSMVRDATGNLFVGTGNNGKVFKMSPDGALSLLADLEEPDILSLARRPDGKQLYAGTSGGGIVYAIDATGSTSVFYDTQELYVWDLAFDAEGGLFAATGDGGRIYRIDKQGQGSVFFDSPETHIMHLLPGGDGTVYAGGEGKGLVYKLSAAGNPFVLHELVEPEACCLVLGADQTLYVAGISVPGTGPRGSPAPAMPMQSAVESAEQAAGEMQNGNVPPPPPGIVLQMPHPGASGGSAGSSTVYRIDADGVVTPIWHSSTDVVHALHVAADGALIAGTGQRGRLYRIDPVAQTWAAMTEVPESQVTGIVGVGETEMLLSGANMGTLWRLGPGHAPSGILESTAFDASTWSAWGRVSWQASTPGGTSIAFHTRAGNSSEPDSSWSPWSPVRDSDDGGGQADSPNARFVQWRAELSRGSDQSETPILNRVSLAYMQRNLKPRVHFVSIAPRSSSRDNGRSGDTGAAVAKSDSRPAPGSPPGPSSDPVKGLRVIKWHASDGNADRLQYDLHFRPFATGKEEATWTSLEEDLSGDAHRWDTASFPDGLYELRVVASDERGNPPEVALSAEKRSEPVLIDNTPPEIRGLKIKPGKEGLVRISGTALDAIGPITKGHYRINAGNWVPLLAGDGIFDSTQESFSFELSLKGRGHAIVVRVSDRAGNSVSERVLR